MSSPMKRLSLFVVLPVFIEMVLVEAVRGQDVSARPAAANVDAGIFAGKAEGEPAEFLVVLRERADLSAAAGLRDRVARRTYVYETLHAHADTTQARVRERLRAAGVRFRSHYLVNMIEVEGDQALANDLAARFDIRAIERNPLVSLKRRDSTQKAERSIADGIEPNIQKIRAPELWARGFTGQGIVIGIADTGFQWDHPALKNQYRGWDGSAVSHDYNWHDAIHDATLGNSCGSDNPAPCDDYGHGTGVAGLAVGGDGAGNRIGVAPGARLIGCRNMDHGAGTPARYTECFEWFLAPTDMHGENPRPELGADVINNSWLCTVSEGCTDPTILRDVVENVRAAGVVVVAAAGNKGVACGNIDEAPAIFDASFTIGATDNNDQMTDFSSLGPVIVDGSYRLKPDLSAPGSLLRTAADHGIYQPGFSGTSAATPHVSGGIALLWSAVPALAGDVDATENALEAGAVPLTSSLPYNPEEVDRFCGGHNGLVVPNLIFGWGRLDVERAFEMITATPQEPSPCVTDSAIVCLDGGRLSEFPLSSWSGGPGDITAGPDGNLWFASSRVGKIGRITTSGLVTEFPVPNDGWPGSIAAGPDGNLWFTEPSLGRIGRITTSGLVTEFPLSDSWPGSIAAGPDGNLWFTAIDRATEYGRIGRITTAGDITIFMIPIDSHPAGIAAGPDGNLWFTDSADSVRRMTTEGGLTGTFPLYAADTAAGPNDIVVGPDGNLWFTESRSNAIGRITTSGVVTTFPIPSGSSPWGIAAGPDGNLWFTQSTHDRVGRITTSGLITEVYVPAAGSPYYPANITAGPDGNLWFTEWSGDRLGRIRPRPTSACVTDATTLCLEHDRFQVRAEWQVPFQGTSGHGKAMPLMGNTGALWFFDPESIEVVVKVLDGCSVNGRFWVFAGGLTNVGVTVTVTDTQTGEPKTYTNPPGTAFAPIQDTVAFSTCP